MGPSVRFSSAAEQLSGKLGAGSSRRRWNSRLRARVVPRSAAMSTHDEPACDARGFRTGERTPEQRLRPEADRRAAALGYSGALAPRRAGRDAHDGRARAGRGALFRPLDPAARGGGADRRHHARAGGEVRLARSAFRGPVSAIVMVLAWSTAVGRWPHLLRRAADRMDRARARDRRRRAGEAAGARLSALGAARDQGARSCRPPAGGRPSRSKPIRPRSSARRCVVHHAGGQPVRGVLRHAGVLPRDQRVAAAASSSSRSSRARAGCACCASGTTSSRTWSAMSGW